MIAIRDPLEPTDRLGGRSIAEPLPVEGRAVSEAKDMLLGVVG